MTLKKRAAWGAVLFFSAIFLAASLGSAFKSLPLNPDMAEMALIYQGTASHGWWFPFTWRFTEDNQILSLLPFTEIYYAIAGVSGISIIVQGWLIFVADAALAAFLARVSGFPGIWATAVFCLCLGAPPDVLGNPAILAYPVTHNSSWAFGLLGAAALVRYITARPRWALPVVLGCVFVGTVSDPWFDAAFTAPAAILAWKSVQWFGMDPAGRRRLITGLVVSYVSGRLGYAGLELLHMVPGRSLTIASPEAMVYHFQLFLRSLGLLLQLYPVPAGYRLWVWLFYIFIFGIFAFSAIRKSCRQTPAAQVLLFFCGFSVGVIGAAFVLTGFASGMGSSRFLENVYYLSLIGIVAAGLKLWQSGSGFQKALPFLFFLSFLTLSITAGSQSGWRYHPDWGRSSNLAGFLEKKDLHYGYGTYFSSGSPLFSIFSNGKVTSRPISCNNGFMVPRLSSADYQFWFKMQTLHGSNKNFVIFPRDKNWKNCTMKAFGIPDEKFFHDGFNVYVYQKPLIEPLLASKGEFDRSWERNNIRRNRRGIQEAGKVLGIQTRWIQSAYSWLLKNDLAG